MNIKTVVSWAVMLISDMLALIFCLLVLDSLTREPYPDQGSLLTDDSTVTLRISSVPTGNDSEPMNFDVQLALGNQSSLNDWTTTVTNVNTQKVYTVSIKENIDSKPDLEKLEAEADMVCSKLADSSETIFTECRENVIQDGLAQYSKRASDPDSFDSKEHVRKKQRFSEYDPKHGRPPDHPRHRGTWVGGLIQIAIVIFAAGYFLRSYAMLQQRNGQDIQDALAKSMAAQEELQEMMKLLKEQNQQQSRRSRRSQGRPGVPPVYRRDSSEVWPYVPRQHSEITLPVHQQSYRKRSYSNHSLFSDWFMKVAEKEATEEADDTEDYGVSHVTDSSCQSKGSSRTSDGVIKQAKLVDYWSVEGAGVEQEEVIALSEPRQKRMMSFHEQKIYVEEFRRQQQMNENKSSSKESNKTESGTKHIEGNSTGSNRCGGKRPEDDSSEDKLKESVTSKTSAQTSEGVNRKKSAQMNEGGNSRKSAERNGSMNSKTNAQMNGSGKQGGATGVRAKSEGDWIEDSDSSAAPDVVHSTQQIKQCNRSIDRRSKSEHQPSRDKVKRACHNSEDLLQAASNSPRLASPPAAGVNIDVYHCQVEQGSSNLPGKFTQSWTEKQKFSQSQLKEWHSRQDTVEELEREGDDSRKVEMKTEGCEFQYDFIKAYHCYLANKESDDNTKAKKTKQSKMKKKVGPGLPLKAKEIVQDMAKTNGNEKKKTSKEKELKKNNENKENKKINQNEKKKTNQNEENKKTNNIEQTKKTKEKEDIEDTYDEESKDTNSSVENKPSKRKILRAKRRLSRKKPLRKTSPEDDSSSDPSTSADVRVKVCRKRRYSQSHMSKELELGSGSQLGSCKEDDQSKPKNKRVSKKQVKSNDWPLFDYKNYQFSSMEQDFQTSVKYGLLIRAPLAIPLNECAMENPDFNQMNEERRSRVETAFSQTDDESDLDEAATYQPRRTRRRQRVWLPDMFSVYPPPVSLSFISLPAAGASLSNTELKAKRWPSEGDLTDQPIRCRLGNPYGPWEDGDSEEERYDEMMMLLAATLSESQGFLPGEALMDQPGRDSMDSTDTESADQDEACFDILDTSCEEN